MSNLYPSAGALFLGGDLDLINDDIRVIAIDSGTYSYNNAHDFLNDVTAGARLAVTPALTGKSVTGGTFDSDDSLWTAVANTGPDIDAMIVYKHTGVESTSPLIVYLNGFTPIVPNGEDITVQWDAATNKIFRLAGS